MRTNTLPVQWLMGAFFALAIQGCSEDPEQKPACEGDACDMDAGTPVMMKRDSSFNTLKPIPDGGIPDGWAPDLDLELQAVIQVNGNNLPCGACSVVAVSAQGGRRPYTYTWSDPSLQGPGPHRICATEPKPLSVTLTDSSDKGGEFAMPAKTVQASAQLACVVDSGVAPDTVGCVSGGSFDAPKPDAVPPITCSSDDGGMLTEDGLKSLIETSSPIITPVVAGQSYEFIYDHIIPLVLGKGVTVEVYGAMNSMPCEKLEKLFTFRLDGTWHQSLCFTPQRAYERTITRIQLDGVWFWFELGQIGTVCKGCAND
jgi:hypothetical protein